MDKIVRRKEEPQRENSLCHRTQSLSPLPVIIPTYIYILFLRFSHVWNWKFAQTLAQKPVVKTFLWGKIVSPKDPRGSDGGLCWGVGSLYLVVLNSSSITERERTARRPSMTMGTWQILSWFYVLSDEKKKNLAPRVINEANPGVTGVSRALHQDYIFSLVAAFRENQ